MGALQKNVKQRLVEWEAEAPQDEAPQDEVPLEDESIFPPEDGDDGARCEDASLNKDDGDFVPTYQSPREAVVVRAQSELDTPDEGDRIAQKGWHGELKLY